MTAKNPARQAAHKNLDLSRLETPLRMIMGLSCLAFVICVGFEIFCLYNLQAQLLYLTIGAALVLLFWALMECRLLTISQKTIPTTKLRFGLLVFVIIVAARVLVFILSDTLSKATRGLVSDLIVTFRWIFLLGYTCVFIFISQAVIELFLLSEKSRANT